MSPANSDCVEYRLSTYEPWENCLNIRPFNLGFSNGFWAIPSPHKHIPHDDSIPRSENGDRTDAHRRRKVAPCMQILTHVLELLGPSNSAHGDNDEPPGLKVSLRRGKKRPVFLSSRQVENSRSIWN